MLRITSRVGGVSPNSWLAVDGQTVPTSVDLHVEQRLEIFDVLVVYAEERLQTPGWKLDLFQLIVTSPGWKARGFEGVS